MFVNHALENWMHKFRMDDNERELQDEYKNQYNNSKTNKNVDTWRIAQMYQYTEKRNLWHVLDRTVENRYNEMLMVEYLT